MKVGIMTSLTEYTCRKYKDLNHYVMLPLPATNLDYELLWLFKTILINCSFLSLFYIHVKFSAYTVLYANEGG